MATVHVLDEAVVKETDGEAEVPVPPLFASMGLVWSTLEKVNPNPPISPRLPVQVITMLAVVTSGFFKYHSSVLLFPVASSDLTFVKETLLNVMPVTGIFA